MKSAGTLTIVDGYTGNSVSQPVSAGAITVYNCTPGATSKFVLTDSGGNIVQQGLLKPTGTCRMINMLNVDNVRDLGGWSCDGGTVKYGKLFRGGEMYGYLTDDGRRQAIDMLGILKEIDLRFASDLNGRTESGFGGPVEMLWVDMTWNDLSYQKESGNIKAILIRSSTTLSPISRPISTVQQAQTEPALWRWYVKPYLVCRSPILTRTTN